MNLTCIGHPFRREQFSLMSPNQFLLSQPRCCKSPDMVWPLRKKTSSSPETDGLPAAEAAATQPIPQNTDIVDVSRVGPQAVQAVPAGAYKIPKGYRITGTVSTNRPVVVEGHLHGGQLNAQEVYVRSGGTLSAPSAVASLIVEGIVEAPVSAREVVEVRSGGVLRGALESPALTVAPGGIINGAQLAVGRQSS